jgi:hypothetical protein
MQMNTIKIKILNKKEALKSIFAPYIKKTRRSHKIHVIYIKGINK